MHSYILFVATPYHGRSRLRASSQSGASVTSATRRTEHSYSRVASRSQQPQVISSRERHANGVKSKGMDDCAAGWRHRWALAHLRDVTFTAARLTHVVIIIIGWLLAFEFDDCPGMKKKTSFRVHS